MAHSIIHLYVHFNISVIATPCGDNSGDLTSSCWSPRAAQCPCKTHQHNFGHMQTDLSVLRASW